MNAQVLREEQSIKNKKVDFLDSLNLFVTALSTSKTLR